MGVDPTAQAGCRTGGSSFRWCARDPLEAVFVRSAAGGELVPLLPAGVALRGTNLISPDGSRILALDAAGRIVLCTISTSAPACAPIAGVRAGDVVSGWTADGRSAFVYQP